MPQEAAQDEQPTTQRPPPLPLPPKDCKACAGAQHLLDAFSRLTMRGGGGSSGTPASTPAASSAAEAGPRKQHPAPTTTSSHPAPDTSTLDQGSGASQRASSSSTSASSPARLPCPPDTAALGHASWTFLHTTAAYYPDEPTTAQQSLMRSMMDGLAEFYPCHVCAEHLREQLKASPPQVGSARELSLWLCKIHNEVNEMVGKPTFDCSRVFERWRDGPEDGSCG